MGEFTTQRDLQLLASQSFPMMPVSLDTESRLIDSSIKNASNTVLLNPESLGSMYSTEPSRFKYVTGETPQIDYNAEAIIERNKTWKGGYLGRSYSTISQTTEDLFGETASGLAFIPWYTPPNNRNQEEITRIDQAFVDNKKTMIPQFLEKRYGKELADNYTSNLEKTYGKDWTTTFGAGAKNENAFGLILQEKLRNDYLESGNLARMRDEYAGIHRGVLQRFATWSYPNLLANYDLVGDVAVTTAISVATGGAGGLAARAASVGSKLPQVLAYSAARKSALLGGMSRAALAEAFPSMEALAGRVGGAAFGPNKLTELGRLSGMAGPLEAGVSAAPSRLSLIKQLWQEGLSTESRIGLDAIAAGTIEKEAFKQIGAKNPFNPFYNLKAWTEFNLIKIVGTDGTVIKDGLIKSNALRFITEAGLKIDDILMVGRSNTFGEHLFKTARTGGVLGFMAGFTNSTFQQQTDDNMLLLENADLHGMNIGQAMADGATLGAMGLLLGSGFGVITSPIMGLKASLNLIDGSATLGTANPRRGLLQLFGSGRMTEQEFLRQHNQEILTGLGGLRAIEVTKRQATEQVRLIFKLLTGDDTTANHYLDPVWLAEHDISVHDVYTLALAITDTLKEAKQVNPLSHEMFADIFTAMAEHNGKLREAGTPVTRSTTTDAIRGAELQEKLNKLGDEATVTDNQTNRLPKMRSLTQQEHTNAILELDARLAREEISKAEYELNYEALKAMRNKTVARERITQTIREQQARVVTKQTELDNANRKFNTDLESDASKPEEVVIAEAALAQEQSQLDIQTGMLEKLNESSVIRTETRTVQGNLETITINGYDINNSTAGNLLIRFLNAIKQKTAVNAMPNGPLRAAALRNITEELNNIESAMDAKFKLRATGETREKIKLNWIAEKWETLKDNVPLRDKFEAALTKQISATNSQIGNRSVSMNLFKELQGTSLGKLFTKTATFGSGVVDSMYSTVDIMFETIRSVEDGQFFAFNDLANPYNTFSIAESVQLGLRKAQGIKTTQQRIRQEFPEYADIIEAGVIRSKRMGKLEVDLPNIPKAALDEANFLLQQQHDFYQFAAEQSKLLGLNFENELTYLPQIITKKLNATQVAKLSGLGLNAYKEKLLKGDSNISFGELQRLGQLKLDSEGGIIEIPASSIFYRTDSSGKPLPLNEMVDRMPKNLDEFKAFEVQRRRETDALAKIPDDIARTLNSNEARIGGLSPAQTERVLNGLQQNATLLLQKSYNNMASPYAIYQAGVSLIQLRNRAVEFQNEAMIKWVDNTIKDLSDNYGISIVEKPTNPTEIFINSLESVAEKTKEPVVKQAMQVLAPEVTLTRDGVTTKLHAGATLYRYVPESQAKASVDVKPTMAFLSPKSAGEITTTLPTSKSFRQSMDLETPVDAANLVLKGNPLFAKENQEVGHAYTMATIAKKIANDFGEPEPDRLLNIIKLEDLQDSFISMEDMVSWTNSDHFKQDMKRGMAALPEGVSKTDLGMFIMSGYVQEAKQKNLLLFKYLDFSPEELTAIAIDFHTINLSMLKHRLDNVEFPVSKQDLLLDVIKQKLTDRYYQRRLDAIEVGLEKEFKRNNSLSTDFKLWSPDNLNNLSIGSYSEPITGVRRFEQLRNELQEVTFSKIKDAQGKEILIQKPETPEILFEKTRIQKEMAKVKEGIQFKEQSKAYTTDANVLQKEIDTAISLLAKKEAYTKSVNILKLQLENKEIVPERAGYRFSDGTKSRPITDEKELKSIELLLKDYQEKLKRTTLDIKKLGGIQRLKDRYVTVTKEQNYRTIADNELKNLMTSSIDVEGVPTRRYPLLGGMRPSTEAKVPKAGSVEERLYYWHQKQIQEGKTTDPLSEFYGAVFEGKADRARLLDRLDDLGLTSGDFNITQKNGVDVYTLNPTAAQRYRETLADSPEVMAEYNRRMAEKRSAKLLNGRTRASLQRESISKFKAELEVLENQAEVLRGTESSRVERIQSAYDRVQESAVSLEALGYTKPKPSKIFSKQLLTEEERLATIQQNVPERFQENQPLVPPEPGYIVSLINKEKIKVAENIDRLNNLVKAAEEELSDLMQQKTITDWIPSKLLDDMDQAASDFKHRLFGQSLRGDTDLKKYITEKNNKHIEAIQNDINNTIKFFLKADIDRETTKLKTLTSLLNSENPDAKTPYFEYLQTDYNNNMKVLNELESKDPLGDIETKIDNMHTAWINDEQARPVGRLWKFGDPEPATSMREGLPYKDKKFYPQDIPKRSLDADTMRDTQLIKLQEMKTTLEDRLQALEDLDYASPILLEDIAAIRAEEAKLNIDINNLKKAGFDRNRVFYTNLVGDIGDRAAEYSALRSQLATDMRFSPMNNLITNFEVPHNWAMNLVSMINERTIGLANYPIAGNYAGERLSFDVIQRGFIDFAEHKQLIKDGLALGYLIERVELVDNNRVPTGKPLSGSTWLTRAKPQDKFIVYDLAASRLDPIHISNELQLKMGETVTSIPKTTSGAAQNIRDLIEYRRSKNTESPSNAITLETIIKKKQEQALKGGYASQKINGLEILSGSDAVTMNEQSIMLLSSMQNWVASIKSLDDLYSNTTGWFKKNITPQAVQNEVLIPAIKNELAKFKAVQKATFLTNSKFTAVTKRTEAKKLLLTAAIEKQLDEYKKEINKVSNLQRLTSRARQVPVFSEARDVVIKDLQKRLQATLEKRFEINQKYGIKSGISVDDSKKLLLDQILNLTTLQKKLIDGGNVTEKEMYGIDLKKIRDKATTKIANERGMNRTDFQKSLEQDQTLVGDAITVKQYANLVDAGVVVNRNGNHFPNPEFTVSDYFRLQETNPQLSVALNKMMQQLMVRAAKSHYGKYPGYKVNEISVDTPGLMDGVGVQTAKLYSWVQYSVNPNSNKALRAISEKISEIRKQPNWKYDTNAQESLKILSQEKRFLLMEDTKQGGRRIKLETKPGQAYPETDMTLQTFINKAVGNFIEDNKNKTRRQTAVGQFIGDDAELQFDTYIDNLESSQEQTALGRKSAGQRPDDILSQKETNARLSEFMTDPKGYADRLAMSGDKPLQTTLFSMGNDNPLTQNQFYYPFAEIFVRKLQEDYANLGAGTETKYIMAGEKDRSKQRSKNIINEVLLLNDISKELTERLPRRSGETSKMYVSKPYMEFYQERFMRELKAIKNLSLDQFERFATEFKAPLISTTNQRNHSIVNLILGMEKPKKDRLAIVKDFRANKNIDVNAGSDRLPQLNKSLEELKGMARDGSLSDTPIFREQLAQERKYQLENYSEPIQDLTQDQTKLPIVSAQLVGDANTLRAINQKIHTEAFNKIVLRVRHTLKNNPEIFLMWAVSEMSSIKEKMMLGITPTKPLSAPKDVQMRTSSFVDNKPSIRELANEQETTFNSTEYNILHRAVEDVSKKSGINISEESYYRQALLASGFVNGVKKAKNPTVAIVDSIATLPEGTPMKEILTRFTDADIRNSTNVLAKLFEGQSTDSILRAVPKGSLINSIDELTSMGLIELLIKPEELDTMLINSIDLTQIIKLTDSGLDLLQQSKFTPGSYGYHNGMDLRTDAKLAMLHQKLKASTDATESKILLDKIQESNQEKFSNKSYQFILSSSRLKLVEAQLRILNNLNPTDLHINSIQTKGLGLLDLFTKKQNGLELERLQLLEAVKRTQTTGVPTMRLPDIRSHLKSIEPTEKTQAPWQEKENTKWTGTNNPQSLVSQYEDAIRNNSTAHYVDEWKDSPTTATQEQSDVWANGLNGDPSTMRYSATPTAFEKKRAVGYGGSKKESLFDNEDLLKPENAELAGMLSNNLGDMAVHYAKTKLAQTSTDVALRNRLKQRLGMDMPEGYGWGDWVDHVRDIIKKFERNPPTRSDGTVDTSSIKALSEYLENLNAHVLQQNGKEVPQSGMPSTMKSIIQGLKNTMLAVLGPGMGVSVALTEIPMALLRKNGSLEAAVRGATELFRSSSSADAHNSILALEKTMHGVGRKMGGSDSVNNEIGYIARLSESFKQMFQPDPNQLTSSGTGKVRSWIENFLSKKAAFGMEIGGLPFFVEKVLQMSYLKEQINLFQVKNKLVGWISKFDNEVFKATAKLADKGDTQAQKQIQVMFKEFARQSGVPLPIASYLWMSKLDNIQDISRLVHLITEAADTDSSFSMLALNKAIIKRVGDTRFSSKAIRRLDDITASKLGYYLELQSRNASPEPFGIGSSMFKFEKNGVGSMFTFLASYPIAAYQTYIMRNGTTHGAASMLSIALGVFTLEIVAKRAKDILTGKTTFNDVIDGHEKSPLAYFLQDASYATNGGLLDTFINGIEMIGANQLLNKDGLAQKEVDRFRPQIPRTEGSAAFGMLNSITRQTYNGLRGAAAGDFSRLGKSGVDAITHGVIGKAPVDIVKAAYEATKSTKFRMFQDLQKELGPITKEDNAVFLKLAKDIFNTIKGNTLEPFEYQPTVKPQGLMVAPDVGFVKETMPNTAGLNIPSAKVKSKVFTPTIINALSNQKGVSPLLVDALIKESQQ